MAMQGLDQFYTNPAYAKECYDVLLAYLPKDMAEKAYFIDPSAGDGVFYDLLPAGRRAGVDVAPAHNRIKQADFLKWKPSRGTKPNRIVIGNPPFGKRGNLALQFLCHASEIADTTALILPMCFSKHALQSKLPTDLRLLKQHDLKREAFRLPNGKPYKVKTEFQIWSRVIDGENFRQLEAEPIDHPDFDMYQYNNTKEALSVFDKKFNFAVPCQGWQNYKRRVRDAAKCEKNKQWMLFYATTKTIQERLENIDYGELAYRVATAIPGFRKRDVVAEYKKHYA
ncbi:MAG: hypothetical protein MJE68_21615 [Proteobacteria bacterium]|nr:hypothetical protein [Pseudomonadota bacterium]